MYNVITRDVERELLPALRSLGMAFYAYNPLAGGLLTGRYRLSDEATAPKGRFFGNSWSERYRQRFWNDENFKAVTRVQSALNDETPLAEASLRWLIHHSKLSTKHGDAVIVGASSTTHLAQNLNAWQRGPLSAAVVSAADDAWEIARPGCAPYFR